MAVLDSNESDEREYAVGFDKLPIPFNRGFPVN